MKKWLLALALSAGLVSTGNAADINRLKTFTGTASQWPWQLNADGTWTFKQPAFSDIAGSVTADQMPAFTGGDCTTAAGSVVLNCSPLRAQTNTWALPQTFTSAPIFISLSDTQKALANDISPAYPDTIEAFCTVTTTAGNTTATLNCVPTTQAAGYVGTWSGFTASDIGKLIQIEKVGNREGRHTTTIANVTNSTTVVLAAAPTQSVSALAGVQVFWGSDQTASLQTAINTASVLGMRSYIRGGRYLTISQLSCMPPASQNNFNYSPPLCQLADGATITAMATMDAVVQYGSAAGDYSGYLRRAMVSGGTLDGNFFAQYGADVPFFEEVTRFNQQTKNTLHAGVRYGAVGSPTASGGTSDQNNKSSRDDYVIPVAGVTLAIPAVVTTAYPHAFTTGRVVSFPTANQTQLTQSFFSITVIDSTHFSLDNTDSTGWSAFSAATVALTMPTMGVSLPVYSISAANPAVVQTITHGYSTGQKVFIADTQGVVSGGLSCVDGVYSITVIDTTHFSVPVNTTGCSAFTSGGVITPLPASGMSGFEAAIYIENANDVDEWGFKGSGYRVGVLSTGSTGWNSKIGGHFWSRVQQGEVLAGAYLGGNNSVNGIQVDCPARFAVWFSAGGIGNTINASQMNCAGFAIDPNNYASFVRLDSGAQVNVLGGSANGESGKNIVYEVSSPVPYTYPVNPNYNKVGFATQYVTYGQIDTVYQAQGAAQKSANLSDLASAATARTNLGLGAVATRSVVAQAIGGSTGSATMTASSANYFMFGTVSNYEPNSGGPQSPFAMTCKNLYARLNQDPGSGNTVTFTLRAASSNTALTCTVTGNGSSNTTCNDTTHSASITAGQMYNFNAQASAGLTAFSTASAGMECDN